LVSALSLAFSSATEIVSDTSHHSSTDFKFMLSPAHIGSLAARYNPNAPPELPSEIEQQQCDTVQFSVADKDGNGISFINSLYGSFGTGIVPKETGFALHGRGAGFSLKKGHANCFAGGKRPYHTIIPALITNPATKDGQGPSLHTVFGVMGAFMQPQGHVQVLLNLLVFGQTPQAALDAPRICLGHAYPTLAGRVGNTVHLEEGIAPEVVAQLEKLGHPVERITDWNRGMFGRGQVIRVHHEEIEPGEPKQIVFSGGSDPRGDGCAAGW
jgi:gamma-glutamyltranspeptidase/glutathione hydrolase